MYEYTVVKVHEMLRESEARARTTTPTEVGQVTAEWPPSVPQSRRHWAREAFARVLVAMATRIAPTVTEPDPGTPALA